tara:strand:+ start:1118 stop:2992 length:1875 start_codon:yes stop_codon:yes gene_type:complete
MKTLNKFLEQAEPTTETEKEDSNSKKEDSKIKQAQSKENQLKKRVLMTKIRAVRGGATGIMASYEPNIEGVIEYFYEEGINEEGFDQLIEEIGLEEFVNFVDESSLVLNEERAARRATVRAKKFDVVKKEVDKADAARKKAKKGEYAPSYAKKETDVTVYDDKPAAKKKAPKKPVAPKKPIAPKKPVRTKKPVTKKVVKAVAKVKKTQPAKKPSKQGLGDRISAAYKAGVKRHRKATQGARVFAKGFKSGAKKAVKFAKDVKKVVSEEEMNEGIMQMIKRVKKKPEKKAEKAMDAGARAKRKLARKAHAKYVSGSEDNVPDDIREEKKKGLDGKACWKGYKLAGTKKKGGKTVDNCVKVDEAKVDAGKSPEQKEKDRNVRKFGVSHNVAGHGKLRRALHRSDRGDKKIKGDKSQYVEMESVVNEASRGEKEVDASNLKKVGRRNINRFETGTVKRTESSGGRKPTYKTVTLANPKPGYGKKSDHYKKNKLSAPSLGRHGTSSETEKGPQKHHTQGVEYHDAAQKQRRQEHKSRRGVKTKGTVASDIKKSLKEEDKAYQYVVSKLKKKYGDGVLTKGDKIKPKTAAQKKAAAAHQAKVDRENAAERAKDPSQGRYPPGYSNRGSD